VKAESGGLGHFPHPGIKTLALSGATAEAQRMQNASHYVPSAKEVAESLILRICASSAQSDAPPHLSPSSHCLLSLERYIRDARET